MSDLDAMHVFFPAGIRRLHIIIGNIAEKERRQSLREERLALIEEKRFYEGCQVVWLKKRSVVCLLKKISKDGFLVFPDSSNRGNPKDWDVIAEQKLEESEVKK